MSGQQIYLALYKGHRDGSGFKVWAARASDWLTRKLTRGQYSHCEIAVRLPEDTADGRPQYECYSASVRDGGVRCKVMPLPKEKWDLIPLPGGREAGARLSVLWTKTRGQRYDLPGALGLVLRTGQCCGRWFCSEWCAEAVGLPEGWRFSPNSLAAVARAAKL